MFEQKFRQRKNLGAAFAQRGHANGDQVQPEEKILPEDLPSIRSVPGVSMAIPETNQSSLVRFGDQDLTVTAVGTGEDFPQVHDWPPQSGVFFTADHVKSYAQVVELGQSVEALRTGQCVTGMLLNGLAEFGVARAENLVALDAPLLGEPLAIAKPPMRTAVRRRFGLSSTLYATQRSRAPAPCV